MLTKQFLYDLLIYIYLLSLIFSYAELMQVNRDHVRLSYYSQCCLWMVWLLETIILIGWGKQFFPLLTRFDSLFLYAWVLVTFTLIVRYFFQRMDLFILCANTLGLIILVVNLFFPSEFVSLAEHRWDELSIIYVALVTVAYVAFSLSCICGILYLVNHRLLKVKRWNLILMKSPSLARLLRFSFYLILLGLISFGIALMVDLFLLVNDLQFLEIGTIIIFLIAYSLLLSLWSSKKWSERHLAWWSIGVFFILLLHSIIFS